MDLTKRCANCGYNHGGDSLDEDGNPITRCPRCNHPIGFPRQRLIEADGRPIPPKTAEELAAIEAVEVEAAAKASAEQEASDAKQDGPPATIPLTGEVVKVAEGTAPPSETHAEGGPESAEDEGHAE